jgi:HlyD family secretion protein
MTVPPALAALDVADPEAAEQVAGQLRDIGTSELQLAQEVARLEERQARLDIRAPVAGPVLGLQVTTPRAVLRPADPVAYMIRRTARW